jgi:CelD/BcsL family acetyltransferase involved in cellulose biosynthesis
MKTITKPTLKLWEQVVSHSAYATFFHTPQWAHIIVKAYPYYQIATKGFILDDGTVAIVPLVRTTERNRYFHWYESMYPGGYGGAVAERVLTPAEVEAIYRRLASPRAAYIHVMGNPFAAQALPASYQRKSLATAVLDLTDGYEALYSRFSRGRRRDIEQARRRGVAVSVAETEAEFREYYEVYEDTLSRWGANTLSHYPYRLFEAIYHYRSEGARLWVARVDGVIVSGAVTLFKNGFALGWHGATREAYLEYHPFSLLIAEIVRQACAEGYQSYDLGPSGGLKSVETWKQFWKAEEREFGSYEWEDNGLYRAYAKLRRGKKEAER